LEISIPDMLLDSSALSNIQLPDPILYNYYKNLDDRIIWIDYEIEADRLLDATRNVLRWNKEDRENGRHADGTAKSIKLLIFSGGGEIEATYNFINICELSKTAIYTFNMGTSMSAALLILLAGHKRYGLHCSRAMIHSGSGGAAGTYEQVEAATQDYKKLIVYMRDYILRKTKIDQKTLNKYKDKDWYLYAEDQVKYGVIDSVIEDIYDLI
jgi:ATP-dependent Clp protease, protease subunit